MAAQSQLGQIEANPTSHTNLQRITAIEATLPHLATKADVEKQTKQLIMWFVATQIALFAGLIHFLG